MPEPLVYDASPEFLCRIMDRAGKGEKVQLLCPKCRKPLIVALTFAQAAEVRVHPGIYCPTSPSHVYRMFTLRSSDAGLAPETTWLDKYRGGAEERGGERNEGSPQ